MNNKVVPKGFEPVFEPDYDFALILQSLRAYIFKLGKGATLKHGGLKGLLPFRISSSFWRITWGAQSNQWARKGAWGHCYCDRKK